MNTLLVIITILLIFNNNDFINQYIDLLLGKPTVSPNTGYLNNIAKSLNMDSLIL